MTRKAFLNEGQAARYLGMSRRYLYFLRRVAEEPLPFFRVGRLVRYRREDIDRWTERLVERERRRTWRRMRSGALRCYRGRDGGMARAIALRHVRAEWRRAARRARGGGAGKRPGRR